MLEEGTDVKVNGKNIKLTQSTRVEVVKADLVAKDKNIKVPVQWFYSVEEDPVDVTFDFFEKEVFGICFKDSIHISVDNNQYIVHESKTDKGLFCLIEFAGVKPNKSFVDKKFLFLDDQHKQNALKRNEMFFIMSKNTYQLNQLQDDMDPIRVYDIKFEVESDCAIVKVNGLFAEKDSSSEPEKGLSNMMIFVIVVCVLGGLLFIDGLSYLIYRSH